MKPAILRPKARQDRQNEVRYYREVAGVAVAESLVVAARDALNHIRRNPGTGSPLLGKEIGIEGLRTWRLGRFPLLWVYFELADALDVVRLLGERQDVASILVDGPLGAEL